MEEVLNFFGCYFFKVDNLGNTLPSPSHIEIATIQLIEIIDVEHHGENH